MIVNETLKIIKQRRSTRSYKDEQIQDEELQAVLEAGTYAANCGDQAWHFTVVQNKELLDRLNLAAKEAVKQMGFEPLMELADNEKFNCLYDAPTLIIVSGNEKAPMPLDADCAAATQNLLLAAESVGLGSCWIFFVIGFYPAPSGINAFENELSEYKGTKGSIHFPIKKPLPYELVTKIVKFRVAENKKWAEEKLKAK